MPFPTTIPNAPQARHEPSKAAEDRISQLRRAFDDDLPRTLDHAVLLAALCLRGEPNGFSSDPSEILAAGVVALIQGNVPQDLLDRVTATLQEVSQ
jgi:hypothetical protein